MARGPFAQRDLGAARAFLDSVYSSGGIRRGPGAKAPADLSPAQVVRYANALRGQADRGEPLSLQLARRGVAITAKGERIVSPEHRRGAREMGEYREALPLYRDPAALLRAVNRLPTFPDHRYSLRVYAVLTDEYTGELPAFLRDLPEAARPASWRTLAVGEATDLVGMTGADLLALAAAFGVRRPLAWEYVYEV